MNHQSQPRREYEARLNRVMDYIDAHLGESLDLETLAAVASFSPFHFHRVFGAAVGETLGAFIMRLRLEKAAGAVAEQQEKPITEIALDYGFSSSAVFSRSFKKAYGMSPTQWRLGGWKQFSNQGKLQSSRYQSRDNYRKATIVSGGYDNIIKGQWRVVMENNKEKKLEYTVKVQEIPEKHVAYIRHTGPYAGDGELFGRLFGQLMKWAGPRNLFVPGESEMLTIYHDSPEITEEDKLRISVGLTVPRGTETSGEVSTLTIPAGTYGVAEFKISTEEYGHAWNSLFAGWLPESGYQCSSGPCYEVYLNDPGQDPQGLHHVAIYLSVEPL